MSRPRDQAAILMIGTGEYTTGFTSGGNASKSDKKAGVVALTLFDMRSRGVLPRDCRLLMAGVNGTKFPAIRQHLQRVVGDAYGIDCQFESYPGDDQVDKEAYKNALKSIPEGSLCIIFTPDDTHFAIAQDCLQAGMHTLVTKPVVKTLEEHHKLNNLAHRKGLLCAIELHKRWDPIYVDARDRILALGPFSYFNAYMSQPKAQLSTFSAWAGVSSDISYYLNSHHIDFHSWCMAGRARPLTVSALGATGVACSPPYDMEGTHDTITLSVQWEDVQSKHRGIALYTSSWIAPPTDVHSQQRFFYMGQKGEVNVDQAHRGYSIATDDSGYASCNPLFMKYTPNADGKFAGQNGYGYRSILAFVAAALEVRNGDRKAEEFNSILATSSETLITTAILEAGYRSLRQGNVPIGIQYDDGEPLIPVGFSNR